MIKKCSSNKQEGRKKIIDMKSKKDKQKINKMADLHPELLIITLNLKCLKYTN